jgi:hypothetical protein
MRASLIGPHKLDLQGDAHSSLINQRCTFHWIKNPDYGPSHFAPRGFVPYSTSRLMSKSKPIAPLDLSLLQDTLPSSHNALQTPIP